MSKSKKSDFAIQSVDLEDIDTGFYNVFNTDLDLVIDSRKVPVYYVGSENWAQTSMVVNDRVASGIEPAAWRDRDNQVLLPLITMKRSDMALMPERFVFKVDGYNDILVGMTPAKDQRTNSRIDKKFNNQVYDMHYIEYPIWVTLTYEVIVYTSFFEDANYLKENILTRFPAFGNMNYRNHEFWVTLENVSNESNVDDVINDERIFKFSFNFTVTSYLIDESTYKVVRNFDTIFIEENVYTQSNIETFDEFIERMLANPESEAAPTFMRETSTYNSQYDPAGQSIQSSISLIMKRDDHTVSTISLPYSFIINNNVGITTNDNMRLFLNGVFYNRGVDYSADNNGLITWINNLVDIQIGDVFTIFYEATT